MAVVLTGLAQDRAETRSASNEVRVVDLSSPEQVEVMRFSATTWDRAPATTWDRAYRGQVLRPRDRIRTRQHGRALLRLSDQSFFRLNPLTELVIQPPEPKRKSIFRLLLGRLYFFHRDAPSDLRIDTPSAAGAVRGTEFVIEVDENNRTTLTLFDGEVELSNARDSVVLKSGERGVAEPGARPTRTALLQADADRAIQWCLYYPGVLDLAELDLTAAEQQALAESLSAYRHGDLLQALAKYPAGRQPGSASEALYLSALWLAVGQVDQTERLLAGLTNAAATNDRVARLSRALQTVVAATRFQAGPVPTELQSSNRLATEWLAESYALQAERKLDAALTAATRAVERSPQFGLAWARAAELEFGFGRIRRASGQLKRGLELSPQNAQALALQGFLLSAENKIGEAITWFERAMTVDGALGNAWLGRGLCRIRKNQTGAGREDLAVAAALEPQRAVLRSYLGKAYSDAGDDARARHELSLARKLDVNDPMSWLYSALNNQQRNRINEAIRDLEKSQELNDNRSVYRSRLLLDQDRAVRSANLARIYQDAGMDDVALREASRAVNYDYANYSAHLFLANSYDQLRDPNRINLRYETPAESEYLIANLLAPVGAGLLAQSVSQQEYSKLFERDRLGVASTTEYLSRGAWTEHGAQYGTFLNSSYLFEANYHTDPGQRPNNDFEEMELRLHLKQQLTPQDTLYFRGIYYDAEGGDVRQYYDPNSANTGIRTEERQEPTLVVGYHHEWSPGIHTLLLAGWLNDDISVRDPSQFHSHPTGFGEKKGWKLEENLPHGRS
jgi:Tfp pilus assembly protein PilF